MLKKITLVTTLALAVVMLGWSDPASAAQSKPMHAKTHAVAARHASIPAGTITVIGVNQPMKVTGSQPAQNELKISRAFDSRGKAVPGLAGRTIQYNNAGKGKDLMQGYSGQRFRVTGTWDRATNIFTVNSYKESPVRHMAKAHLRHHAGANHVAKAEAKHPGSKTMAKADTKSPSKSTAPATPAK